VQGDAIPMEEVTLGVELFCGGAKFKEDSMIIALNGFDTILGNIFLDAYRIDILKDGYKFKVIAKLANKLISLEVDY
jgi:hypothetical protein